MSTQQQVVLIGAGIVGLCCARYLQNAGFHVTVIDRSEPGQATSYGNAGVISPWSCVPQSMPGVWKNLPKLLLKPDSPASVPPRYWLRYLPWLLRFIKQSSLSAVEHNSNAMFYLMQHSPTLYHQLLKDSGHESLVQPSAQIHAFRNKSAADLNALGYVLRRDKGAEVQVINANELQEIEPALSRDFQAAIVMPGIARSLNPGRLCSVLSQQFKDAGGDLVLGDVTHLERRADSWHIAIGDQSRQAPHCVVCAGVWSSKLLAPFGLKTPWAAERGYHLWFDDNGTRLSNSIMDVESHVIGSSMENGIRVAGIAEFSDISSKPSDARITTVKRMATRMIPALKDTKGTPWMGVRTSFPDSLPVIDKVSGQQGLYTAFGHSHYGLMTAPQTGKLLSEFVMGKAVAAEAKPFSSTRF